MSGDGQLVASGGWTGEVNVWDVATGNCLLTYNNTSMNNRGIVLSGDGKYVASNSWNERGHTVREWDIRSGICTRTVHTQNGVDSLAYDPNNSSRLTWNEDDNVHGLGISRDQEWVIQDGKQLFWLPPDYRADGTRLAGTEIVAAAAGSRIAIGCDSGHVLIVGVRAGEVERR